MPGFDREHGAFFLHAKNLQAGADTVTDGMITDPVSAPPSTVWCSASISVIFHNRHCGCHVARPEKHFAAFSDPAP